MMNGKKVSPIFIYNVNGILQVTTILGTHHVKNVRYLFWMWNTKLGSF